MGSIVNLCTAYRLVLTWVLGTMMASLHWALSTVTGIYCVDHWVSHYCCVCVSMWAPRAGVGGVSVYTWGSNVNTTLGHDLSCTHPQRLELSDTLNIIQVHPSHLSHPHSATLLGGTLQVSHSVTEPVWKCAHMWTWFRRKTGAWQWG